MKDQAHELKLVQDIFGEMSKDMGSMLERGLSFDQVKTERVQERAVGEGLVHISFRFSFETDEQRKVGCFLIPLPDASLWAAYLLALGDEASAKASELEEPDTTMKESMLLLGYILANSVGRATKRCLSPGMRVGFEGCQGVRANVRPAFEYADGDELIVARAAASMGDARPFQPILMLPILS